LVNPAVTVIGRDMELLGRTAAGLLLEMIDGAAGHQIVTLPTWLVVRESSLCTPPRRSDSSALPE
jgi:DNA-binding LacI/PurR family transcriptional regulator